MSIFLKAVINYSLIILAIILVAIVGTIGFLYRMIYSGRGRYFLLVAIAVDQLGNVICGALFDHILINKNVVGASRFGSPDETVSSVVGKNHRSKTLTRFGEVIYTILNRIENEHSEKAIEDDETFPLPKKTT